ncbi:hypothetical protein [Frigoribacterium sp. UYMn621]|uniref:hypothetical protein n=1 Tax=Frigoribacterium sp. UYMn621 TaxID=3156343 RepID=UPI00339A7CAF
MSTSQAPFADAANRVLILRMIADHLKNLNSRKGDDALAEIFDRYADLLKLGESAPQDAEEGPYVIHSTLTGGQILMVPVPTCDAADIATHVAAVLTAGKKVLLASLGPVNPDREELEKQLAEILPRQIFSCVLSHDSWVGPNSQTIVIVTPEEVFLNEMPWARYRAEGTTADEDLVTFYRSHVIPRTKNASRTSALSHGPAMVDVDKTGLLTLVHVKERDRSHLAK